MLAGWRRLSGGRRQQSVAQVCDSALADADHEPFQLPMLGAQFLEQVTSLAEQHGDEMDFHLIEKAGSDGALRGAGAVHEDVLSPAALACFAESRLDVVRVVNRRPCPWPSLERDDD